MRTLIVITVAVFVAACGSSPNTNTANMANGNASNSNANAAQQNLAIAERPQNIRDMMAARGEQDTAVPTLRILEPAANATVNSSTVRVRLNISGDLKGYMPGMDPQTKMGNHVHVILDNQPYEAYYNLDREFELRNVSDGDHTLRVFPSRPWHESYKNDGAFQMVRFTVRNGGADNAKPATTNTGQQMSNVNSNANTAPTPEGKDMQNSNAGEVNQARPLLTYSRPKGDYKGGDADTIMIDFWLANTKLVGDGGEHRVRYTVDGGEPKFIDKWEPIWLSGWANGKHSVRLDLVDRDGKLVDNGGFNSTTREITVAR